MERSLRMGGSFLPPKPPFLLSFRGLDSSAVISSSLLCFSSSNSFLFRFFLSFRFSAFFFVFSFREEEGGREGEEEGGREGGGESFFVERVA